jgi:hypothetical protein
VKDPEAAAGGGCDGALDAGEQHAGAQGGQSTPRAQGDVNRKARLVGGTGAMGNGAALRQARPSGVWTAAAPGGAQTKIELG